MASMWNNIRTVDEALQKFKENCKELAIIIQKQEKQIQFLDNKASHMSMFYLAFQLLIFLIITSNSKISSSPDQCRKYWWKFFLLSLSLALLFGLNFTVTVSKYMRIKCAQDRNFIDQQQNYQQMSYFERLGRSSSGMDIFTTINADSKERQEQEQDHEPDIFAVYQRYAHVAITTFALLAFTVLVLHTCHRASACA